jgi:hypothetical protein
MSKDAGTEQGARGLLGEVERYLVAVEAFRAAGREPRWLPERDASEAQPAPQRIRLLTDSMGGIA